MAKLEELSMGSVVNGLLPNEPVTVVSTKWYGSSSIEVFYKTNQGLTGSLILYREDEPGLSIAEKSLPWSFDVDGKQMRLVSEAYRIHLAHLFDPYLAVHTSAIEPLPHQISAVYEEMLPRLPLRYVLADDPGAGKTIMTGLLLKELIIRGDLKRCMIVCPGNLAEQWQDELFQKFHLRFEILTNDRLESAVSGNVFTEMNYCIARLDKLSRDEELQEKLKITDWDLIVCDEAHKMSATFWGGEVKYTKRFQLGRLLSGIARHFLLLTATPHNGKEEDFQLFMSLVDQDRFEGACRSSNQSIDVSDVMRRLVKEDLLKFDGTPLFPERLAYTVNYDLSPAEAQLYTAVADCPMPDDYPSGALAPHFTGGSCVPYGLDEFYKLFTNRQLTALTTFSSLVYEAQQKAELDAVAAGRFNDHIALHEGGRGARAYSEAIGVFLAFIVDKMSDLGNALNRWEPNAQCPRQLFARQAIPMVWDFAEANIFSTSSGSWNVFVDNQVKCMLADSYNFPRDKEAVVEQFDAQSDCGMRNILVSTDPPYYDNIGYADLSDFFYVWLRQTLKDYFPNIFRTMLVPKAEELVATPYRFEGGAEEAKDFFEDGMYKTCCQLYKYSQDDIPVTIYYAFKQSENDSEDETASTGWEKMNI